MRSARAVQGGDGRVAQRRRRVLAATSAVGWPRATSIAKLGPGEHADARRCGTTARAISWPSRPVPSWKPLHSQSTAASQSRPAGGAARGSSPAIGVATTTSPPRAWRTAAAKSLVDLQRRRQRRSRAGSARCGAATASAPPAPASRAHSRVGCARRGVDRQRGAPRAGAEHREVHRRRAPPASGSACRCSASARAVGRAGDLGLRLRPAAPRTSPGSSLPTASPAGSRRGCRRRRRWRAGTDRRCPGRRCRGSAAAARRGCCGSRRCRPAWPRPGTASCR